MFTSFSPYGNTMSEKIINWNNVHNELKGFVYNRVKDKALTDDIVHDVFLKVQDKILQLRDTKKIFGWIYQITRNTIIDHYRKRSRMIRLSDLDLEPTPGNFNECVSGVIAELLPTLPDKYRVPLEMTELHDIPQMEVAAKLDLSYTAAKARVQRARRILKDKVDQVLIVKPDGYGNVILCKNRRKCC
jgi:RNA polymerase sigma-70 factor, ECF subfamily